MSASWSAAVALDLALGEPPSVVHPVVHIGRAIATLDAYAPRTGTQARAAGAMVAFGPAALAAAASVLARPSFIRIWLLKSTFALRELLAAAGRVEDALRDGGIGSARAAVSEMVSRPVTDLDERLVASAAIESLAENLCDSYVAPLFWYGLAGLPGAAIYRAVNTADAMVGYRDARHRDVGLVAARTDDLLSFVPARITALALAAAAPIVGGSPTTALRIVLRDARATASPNSGWPMAAAAGALGLGLEKVGYHRLGDGRDPGHADIARARRLALAAAALITAAFLAWRAR
ncbi:MAG: cobalamin biosynthesis protein CobD [Chloroflexi bacterium]|nr:cobalamin biosynthesis protein CobD [Chloroflexota bacterium]